MLFDGVVCFIPGFSVYPGSPGSTGVWRGHVESLEQRALVNLFGHPVVAEMGAFGDPAVTKIDLTAP